MLTFSGAVRAIDNFLNAGTAGEEAIDLYTPVHFDPALMPRLIAAHEALNARFATLVCLLDRNDAQAAEVVRECLKQFQQLRRAEAIWLYPVIAHAVDEDDAARGRLTELRLVTLTLARRTLRCFEALVQAIDRGGLTVAAADELSRALAEYLRRSETEIYPLYGLMSLLPGRRSAHAA